MTLDADQITRAMRKKVGSRAIRQNWTSPMDLAGELRRTIDQKFPLDNLDKDELDTRYPTLSGGNNFTGVQTFGDDVTFNDVVVIDVTSAEAFLVRKDADGGDVFAVSTSGDLVTVTGKLLVTGEAEIDGALTSGALVVESGGATVTGDSSVTGDLIVTGALTGGTVTGTIAAGGSDTEIQFNNAGALDGISTLTTDGTGLALAGALGIGVAVGSIGDAKIHVSKSGGFSESVILMDETGQTEGGFGRLILEKIGNGTIINFGLNFNISDAGVSGRDDATRDAWAFTFDNRTSDSMWRINYFAGSDIYPIVVRTNGVKIGHNNNTSPGAALEIVGVSASRIVGIDKGAASQSANLREWQNSSGTVLASVSAAGVAFFPTIELGHASDTTLARVSAGVVSIEGVNVMMGDTGSTGNAVLIADGGDNVTLKASPATIGAVNGTLTVGDVLPITGSTYDIGLAGTTWANVWADLVNGADYCFANGWRAVEAEVFGHARGVAFGYNEAWVSGRAIYEHREDVGDKPPALVVTDEYVELLGVRFTQRELMALRSMARTLP